jgi:transposase-like protein
VVRCRLRDKLRRVRDLPEMFALRGMAFSQATVREWQAKLTPALNSKKRVFVPKVCLC